MTKERYVFISYSSKDSQSANRVVRMLSEAEIAYWRAPEMIPAGSNYAREIPQAIEGCDIFVLLISKHSQESIWVEKEIDCAVNANKLIVPLHTDEEPLNNLFRFYLNNVQSIYFSNDWQEAIRLLRERIEQILFPQGRKNEEKQGNANTGMERVHLENTRDVTENMRRNYNSLNINLQPVQCQFCGGALRQTSLGIYRCTSCNRENYDYYNTVRNFLEKNGPHSALEIQRATGVPQNVIIQFLEDEMLEIPKASSIRLVCSNCGMRIRSGNLCDSCKARGRALRPRKYY